MATLDKFFVSYAAVVNVANFVREEVDQFSRPGGHFVVANVAGEEVVGVFLVRGEERGGERGSVVFGALALFALDEVDGDGAPRPLEGAVAFLLIVFVVTTKQAKVVCLILLIGFDFAVGEVGVVDDGNVTSWISFVVVLLMLVVEEGI